MARLASPTEQVRWMTSRETSDYIKCSQRTLATLLKEGKIPVSRVSSRMLRFDRKAVDQWLEEKAAK